MRLFDKLYAAKEEVISAIQKPARERMLKRAAERSHDDLESKKVKAEIERGKLEHALANCENEDEAAKIFKQIAALDREIDEAAALTDCIDRQYKKMFSEVAEEGK